MFSFSKQPQPTFKVLSDGFHLFSHTFSKIWYWSFLFHFINALPNFFSFFNPTNKNEIPVFLLVLIFVTTLIQVYASVFFMHRIYAIAVSSTSSAIASFKVAQEKWATALFAYVIVALFLGTVTLFFFGISLKINLVVGIVILGLPFLFVAVLLMFYLPLIIFKNEKAIESFKKSIQLVWGHWLQTFIILLSPMLIGVLLLIFAFGIQTEKSIGFILSTIVIFSFIKPLIDSLLLVQFNNLQLLNVGKKG